MKSIHLTHKFWVVTTTLVIVTLIFVYYFMIYIPDRESMIVKEKFRVLERTGKNIQEMRTQVIQSLAQIDKSYEKRYLEEWQAFEEKARLLASINEKLKSPGSDYDRMLFSDTTSVDPWESFKQGLRGQEFLRQMEQSLAQLNVTQLNAFETNNYQYYYDPVGKKSSIDTIFYDLNVELEFGDFRMQKVEDFLGPVVTNIPFDNFMIIRVFERQINGKDSVVAGICYQDMKNRVQLDDVRSLVTIDHGLETTPVTTLMLSNGKFKLFMNRIRFDQQNQEDWILCGLVRESAFNAKARSVDLIYIVFIGLISLFILMAMPVLKLLVMSPIERLQIVNVWFTGFSIVSGTALVTVLLLFWNNFLSYSACVDNDLLKLSVALQSRFNGELKQAYQQLNVLQDSFPEGDLIINNNRASVIREKIYRKPDNRAWLKEKFGLDSLTQYPYFNEVFWLDGTFKQRITLTTHAEYEDKEAPYLDNRSYVTNVVKDKLWSVSGLDSMPFTLQSINSFRNQTFEAGIGVPVKSPVSMPSDDAPLRVLAMATRLHSIMDPLLPPGYAYCIVDHAGEVKFHSDITLNNQENFFEETNRNAELTAAVLGRLHVQKTISYKDAIYRVNIRPVSGTDLHLIVLHNRNYFVSPIITTLGYALLLLLLTFCVLGVHLSILFISTYRPTKLRIRRFFLNWLRPRRESLDAQCGPDDIYATSVLVQVILITLLVVLILFHGSMGMSLIFILLPVYLLLFHYLLIEKKGMPLRKMGSLSFVGATFVFIVLMNLMAARLSEMSLIWAIQGIMIVIFALALARILYWRPQFLPGIYARIRNRKFQVSLRLWLILVSVLPVFYFFKASYYKEDRNWKKFELLDLARSAESRRDRMDVEMKEKLGVIEFDLATRSSDKGYQRYVQYTDSVGNYVSATDEFAMVPIPPDDRAMPTYVLDRIEFLSRPPWKDEMERARQALFGSAADDRWKWYRSGDSIMLRHTNSHGAIQTYATMRDSYTVLVSPYTGMIILVAVVFAFMISRTARLAVKFTYGLGLIPDDNRGTEDANEIINAMHKGNRMFVVGLPHSGKNGILIEFKKQCTERQLIVRELDFGDDVSERILLGRVDVFIIRHFELSINNHEQNKKKYALLKSLMNRAGARVIISSSIQPSVIFDFYDKSLESLQHDKNSEESRSIKSEYKQFIRLWKNLLSGYTLVYASLQPKGPQPPPETDTEPLQKVLRAELHHGAYLPSLREFFSRDDYQGDSLEEDVVLKVEELADTYYHSLWNSFSDAEKFLLYDLAKDRFVNMRNLKLIRILMQKGVIVREDSLRIMNKSFNNFILSVVRQDEEMFMEQELRKRGTWDTVRLVLIISLLGLVGFIAMAQQEWMQNFNALITALGGVVALLLRFGGLFGSRPQSLDK